MLNNFTSNIDLLAQSVIEDNVDFKDCLFQNVNREIQESNSLPWTRVSDKKEHYRKVNVILSNMLFGLVQVVVTGYEKIGKEDTINVFTKAFRDNVISIKESRLDDTLKNDIDELISVMCGEIEMIQNVEAGDIDANANMVSAILLKYIELAGKLQFSLDLLSDATTKLINNLREE